ncbi:hypothetical protein NliqN6_0473 [Naganishia liquefaciens]|uniref:Uncharacterized protein n=1 Tax=Naganishia liquefaciens TaxID=104408 RepID=A0A8H3YDS4_9TREE|nr:hypothetical protein NliqN6_0473 [Naganishia liquefaciens]
MHSRPPPEEEKRISSSSSSTSKSTSSSSSSSSRLKSSSSRDVKASSDRTRDPSGNARSSSSASASLTSIGSQKSPLAPSSSVSREAQSSSGSRSSLSNGASLKEGSSGLRPPNLTRPSTASTRASSSRSSASGDTEPDAELEHDRWAKAHPSASLSKPRPSIWPFPIGLARPAAKNKDGKERAWWENGIPHQVGYIDQGDIQSAGRRPVISEREIDPVGGQSSSQTPKASREEIREAQAIMKGEKELSKDKEKRAKQKELIKIMAEKSPRDDKDTKCDSALDVNADVKSSTDPTPDELAEAKAIMKGRQELSTRKDKRAKQEELIKMITSKKSENDDSRIVANPSSSTSPMSTEIVASPTAEELVELQKILQGKSALSEDKGKRSRQKALMKMLTSQAGSTSVSHKKEVRFNEGAKPKSSLRQSASSSGFITSDGSEKSPSITLPSSRRSLQIEASETNEM